MTPHFDFAAAGWVMIALGGILFALTLGQALFSQESFRRQGWWTLLTGAGVLLQGFALVRRVSWDDPSSPWQWVGTLLVGAAGVVGFSQRVRAKRAGHIEGLGK